MVTVPAPSRSTSSYSDDPMAWYDVSDLAGEAWTLIPIDLVDYDQAKGAFREAIDRHGRTVYERPQG